jgi:hypothetical protein
MEADRIERQGLEERAVTGSTPCRREEPLERPRVGRSSGSRRGEPFAGGRGEPAREPIEQRVAVRLDRNGQFSSPHLGCLLDASRLGRPEKEETHVDIVTITWINTVALIAGAIAILVNLGSLLYHAREHDGALRALEKAVRRFLDTRR